MTNPDFVYTTYIKTTQEKLWNAIINPEFTRQYWTSGIVSDWKQGSQWQQFADDGKTVKVGGAVLESNPPKHLVFTWFDPANPEDDSTVTFTIDTIEDMVRLTVVHGGFKSPSTMAGRIVTGWPRVLSSLKTLLETGKALDALHAVSCAQTATK